MPLPRQELIDEIYTKVAQMAFDEEPNLCCTEIDVEVVADIESSAGTLELIQCPQCEQRWVRHTS